MHLKLREEQLKAITHTLLYIYINIMVTTGQKSIKDKHTKEK